VRKVAILALACAAAALPAAAQAAPAARACGAPRAVAQRLQAILFQTLRETTASAGMLMHVEAPRLGISWSGAAGLDDRARRTRLAPRATVRLASNSKLYVAAATMRLVEQGRVGLRAPISRYLPADLVARLPGGSRITVEMLLRHTSGLYDYATDPAYVDAVLANPRRRWTRPEQIDWALSHGQPYGAPGATFNYSDTGYLLLAWILERRTGLRSWGDALTRLLGARVLGRTYLEDGRRAPRGSAARAHQYFGDVDTFSANPSFDLHGGGGLVASMRDLARFWDALFSGAVFARPATLRTLTSLTPQSGTLAAAMGLYRDRLAGVVEYDHGGFFGTRANHFVAPDVTITTSTQQALEEGNPIRPAYPKILAALRGVRATSPSTTLCR
jgi:D-alanyl-D-alanine carboxypeptidase